MLGLLLFISALAVLIICARMHDCHVDTVSRWFWYELSREKTHWKLDKPIISKLVLLYVSHTWRVYLSLIASVDMRLSDVTWQGNIIKSEIELWLWAMNSPRTAAPHGEDVSKRKKESNKSIQNKMSKMYTECTRVLFVQIKKPRELFVQYS